MEMKQRRKKTYSKLSVGIVWVALPIVQVHQRPHAGKKRGAQQTLVERGLREFVERNGELWRALPKEFDKNHTSEESRAGSDRPARGTEIAGVRVSRSVDRKKSTALSRLSLKAAAGHWGTWYL